MYKNFKVLWAISLLVGANVSAQTMFSGGEFQPYDELSVGAGELEESVKNRVLYFAHFTCPYCRQAHAYMHEWGDQLPGPYELEVVPAIGIKEHLPMAMAYYAVLQVAPARLREFEQHVFRELQEKKRSATDPNSFIEAAGKIGIDQETFRKVVASEATKRFVERAYRLTEIYAIEEVPVVIVANRYKTGPGRVYNEQQSFVSILNGLISMHYQERDKR